MFFKRLSISLIIFAALLFSTQPLYAVDVYLGGQSIGIKLDYDGVLITGTYDISIDNKTYNPSSDGFKKGDLIIKINNESVETIQELSHAIEKDLNSDMTLNLTIKRQNDILKKQLHYQYINNEFSTGLYVQDGMSGIGTVTCYLLLSHKFAALGHMMGDAENRSILKNGTIYDSYIKNIRPSLKGDPGEKIAEIGDIELGKVYDNNQLGIYGTYNPEILSSLDIISTANKNDVKKGNAYFLTVIEGDEIKKCDIEITSINLNAKDGLKGITFKVTDKQLLNQCNGIVQGMSGSPIIQDGKLVGAVTHVLVNDPTRGYGIFIENMLEAAEKGAN